MVLVIGASALGVIIISVTGGLILRRLFGEIAELRRQITGIDREMRAQRARVKFLRKLLDESGEEGERLPEVAVAYGEREHPAHSGRDERAGPHPVRRKGHLGLYLGGAVAAAAGLSEAARNVIHQHQGQILGAMTGCAVTAATVSMVAVQPWTIEPRATPPASATTAAGPAATAPPGLPAGPPGGAPSHTPVPSPSKSSTGAQPSASPAPPAASPDPSLMPVVDASASAGTPSATPGGPTEAGTPGGTDTPPGTLLPPEPSWPAELPPPSEAAPPAGQPVTDALPCLGVALPPVRSGVTCLLGR